MPAAIASFAWRSVFILVHLGLGIHWGLLSRGIEAVLRFAILDSLINALLISLILSTTAPAWLKQRLRSCAHCFWRAAKADEWDATKQASPTVINAPSCAI